MRKLLLTCECGERLQVPRSAIGRTGLCPSCGRTIAITASNTSTAPVKKERPRDFASAANTWWQGGASPSKEARQQFAQAADLYFNRRYAEALMLFTALAKQFPGNPDIEAGRQECLNALHAGQGLALEDRSGERGRMDSGRGDMSGRFRPRAETVENAALDDETVKRVVLEKLLHGATDDVQLRAAELAWRILQDCRGAAGAQTPHPRSEPARHDEPSRENRGNNGEKKTALGGDEGELDPLSEWTGFSNL